MGYYIAHNVTGHFLEFPSKEELMKSTRYMSAAYLFFYDISEDSDNKSSVYYGRRGHIGHLDNKEDLIWWLNTAWRNLRQRKFKYPKNVTKEYLKRVDEVNA